jgi:hypothetical protein
LIHVLFFYFMYYQITNYLNIQGDVKLISLGDNFILPSNIDLIKTQNHLQRKKPEVEIIEPNQEVSDAFLPAPKEVVEELKAPTEEVQIEQEDKETDIYFKIQDPDGYTNMRDAPGGSIVRRVLPNEKFKVSGESRKYKVVEFDNGEIGYIHNSRVVEYR